MANSPIQTDLSNAPVNNVMGSLTTSAALGFNNARADVDVVQSIEHYYQEQTQIQTLQFPFDRPKFYFLMAFSKYDRADMFSVNATLNAQQSLILPLPQQIDDPHMVNYTQESFGPMLGAGADIAFRNVNSSGNGLTALQPSTQDIGELAGGGLGTLAGVADAAGLPATAALGAVLGVTPNQFFTVLLTGPQYKRLNFTWHLVPRSFEESRMIMDIVRFLNNAMAPGLSLGGALFSFPLVVRCAFLPNFPYLFRFKPAVIENMVVSYAPLGQPAFYHSPDAAGRHAPPESVRIQISLLEMEYWLKSDFKDETHAADDTKGTERSVDDPIVGLTQKAADWYKQSGLDQKLQEFLGPNSGGISR